MMHGSMSVQYKDYYATLGVSRTASQDEIRKAFRKLAREFHPDVAKDKKNAENKFKEINEAYEVLSDPEKREKYDTLGADWEHGARRRAGGGVPPGADPFGGGGFSFGGTGFSDFFEQFFGGGAGRQAGRGGFGGFSGMEPERGGDIEADLLVTIEEALNGAKKKISFQRDRSSKVETYEVRIPKGVRAGQKIRLAGQGQGAGESGAGDLYLVVRFERHPDWRIDGVDLLADLDLPVARVVIGAEVEVPTPDGPVLLKVPAGTQPGRKFRLRGRGLPSTGGTRGDFYVQLGIVLPDKLSNEEHDLWQRLANLSR